MSLPALRALHRALPDATITVAARSNLASLYESQPWIDEVIPFATRPGAAGWGDRWSFARAIRGRRFDAALVLPKSFDSALTFFLAKVPVRIGFRTQARAVLLTSAVPYEEPSPDRHQANDWLDLVEAATDLRGDPNDIAIEVDDRARKRMEVWLSARRKRPRAPLIALAPGAAYGPAKEWPAVRWIALVDQLEREMGAESLLVGTPKELERCEEVSGRSSSGAIVSAGETTIEDVIALLSLCDGFAGNDSGAMHLAGALGLPTVGIFGSTNPRRTGPLGPRVRVVRREIECSPCFDRTCRFGHTRCLTDIPPVDVLRPLEELGAFQRSP